MRGVYVYMGTGDTPSTVVQVYTPGGMSPYRKKPYTAASRQLRLVIASIVLIAARVIAFGLFYASFRIAVPPPP